MAMLKSGKVKGFLAALLAGLAVMLAAFGNPLPVAALTIPVTCNVNDLIAAINTANATTIREWVISGHTLGRMICRNCRSHRDF